LKFRRTPLSPTKQLLLAEDAVGGQRQSAWASVVGWGAGGWHSGTYTTHDRDVYADVTLSTVMRSS
jgi:hypothetical protein